MLVELHIKRNFVELLTFFSHIPFIREPFHVYIHVQAMTATAACLD